MKKLIIGNWKMNPQTQKHAKALLAGIKTGLRGVKEEVVICPPFIYLPVINNKLSIIKLGAQNCFWEEKGAYTGEISPNMLKDLGVKYVLLGHSEREQILCENNETTSKKIKLVMQKGLLPILCCGETEEQRKNSQTFTALEKEITECLEGTPKTKISQIIFAYEPIWAVGSGKACSPDDALTAILFIRNLIAKLTNNKKASSDVKVLYGGSVNFQNAKDYLLSDWISGLLVGEKSLDIKEFTNIIKNT